MPKGPPPVPDKGEGGGPLFAYSGGMFFDTRIRRILKLAGYHPTIGWPKGAGDRVVVWGRTGPSKRGQAVARRTKAELVTLEDAFLRSVLTGRAGEPPLGVMLDRQGVYFDTTGPSDLEDLLNHGDLFRDDLTRRARDGIARLKAAHLSKYNGFDPSLAVPEPGYVLVIDQTRGDASIRLGGASDEAFAGMLKAARAENPGRRIVIKTHPETAAGFRKGHFGRKDADENTTLLSAPVSPWHLFEGAVAVYAVTSLMGFEAIMAGHRPHLFGRPFYGGWGLSADRVPYERRLRPLTREALFAGAMLEFPLWYDPYRDQLGRFEDVVDCLEARARAWREDCHGYDALEIRLWKRKPFRRFFAGAGRMLSFRDHPRLSKGSQKRGLVWAGKLTPEIEADFQAAGVPLCRVEDGFLRSRGLGAELVPPLSLVLDDRGIYYDPTRESGLDVILNASDGLTPAALSRAGALREALIANRISKYNIGADGAGWPADRPRILVPGQVEDDASIRLGAGEVATNLDLLSRVRAENPQAFVIYKPHPDVEAGLRPGKIAADDLARLADAVALGMDAIAAIDGVDEVWTMTSLLGFEALLRDKPVTCLGRPFYAGWGLTKDLGGVVPHRTARLSLEALIHGALIAYPRYFDPVTGTACPVEVVVERLAEGTGPGRSHRLRVLSKLQGVFASFAPFWR